jgi:aspartate-semialdehyde dehydrogenase
MKLVIAGATGLVGREMLKVLEERNLTTHFQSIILCASPASKGVKIESNSGIFEVTTLEEALNLKPDYALFSAGGEVSRKWAPLFAHQNCTVIDNSSAWRMDAEVPLVVPEINAHTLGNHTLIANPNCSTIQLAMVLQPLHLLAGIKRVVVSTYQSVSGTGKAALEQLFDERAGNQTKPVYPHPIDLNCIPQCDVFMENGYTREEMKMIQETRKILNNNDLLITATAVRIPVTGGHSESVNIEFNQHISPNQVRAILSATQGICVLDNPATHSYPMPIISAGKDEVFVGRIRKDESIENGIQLWITADNLRKGAATNAVQILQQLLKQRHGIA